MSDVTSVHLKVHAYSPASLPAKFQDKNMFKVIYDSSNTDIKPFFKDKFYNDKYVKKILWCSPCGNGELDDTFVDIALLLDVDLQTTKQPVDHVHVQTLQQIHTEQI